jgi:hypothetical protein
MSGTIWSKFFWQDWDNDPALRMCSFAAQGLWMRMLCLAAKADPIGYVVVNGKPLDSSAIARLTGGSEQEVDSLIDELDRNGVLSRDRRGAIYNRRMVRDAKKAAHARKIGKLGGNPTLSKTKRNPPQDNGGDNGGVNGAGNPHKPRAKSQKPEIPPKPPDGAEGAGGLGSVDLRVQVLAAFTDAGSPVNPDTSRVGVWLAKGYDPAIVMAVVQECLAKNPSIRNLKYFDQAIEEAHRKGPPPPAQEPLAKTDPARLRQLQLGTAKSHFRDLRDGPGSHWLPQWKGRPGDPDCTIPADVIEEAKRAVQQEPTRSRPERHGSTAHH